MEDKFKIFYKTSLFVSEIESKSSLFFYNIDDCSETKIFWPHSKDLIFVRIIKGFNVFRDQKLYDEEYLKEKSEKKAQFLSFFGEINQNPNQLEAFIAQHKNPLLKTNDNKNQETKENLLKIEKNLQNVKQSENLLLNQNQNIKSSEIKEKKENQNEIPTLDSEDEQEMKTFSIQHKNNQILIREFGRFSKEGVQVIKNNSKYLNLC